jgi:hypothetical protein
MGEKINFTPVKRALTTANGSASSQTGSSAHDHSILQRCADVLHSATEPLSSPLNTGIYTGKN